MSEYRSTAQLLEDVADLVGCADGRATQRTLAMSVQGRPVIAVDIPATGSPDATHNILVTSNIHGMEAIAGEVGLATLRRLLEPEPSGAAAQLLDVASVAVLPLVNPDGRTASLDARDTPIPSFRQRRNAHGVDLNRNFPYPPDVKDAWHPLSGTDLAFLPWYRGPEPLSEPESRAVADVAAALEPTAALALHSVGAQFLYPYCYRAEPPADEAAFLAMGAAFQAAQPATPYTVKQSHGWYAILGDLNNYLYDTYGTLSVTIELGRIAEAVRDDPRRVVRPFWWANPSDPDRVVADVVEACCASLVEAVRIRSEAPRSAT